METFADNGYTDMHKLMKTLYELVHFDQHQQFAKNFRQVAPVDFINDEEPISVRVISREPSELVKHTVAPL